MLTVEPMCSSSQQAYVARYASVTCGRRGPRPERAKTFIWGTFENWLSSCLGPHDWSIRPSFGRLYGVHIRQPVVRWIHSTYEAANLSELPPVREYVEGRDPGVTNVMCRVSAFKGICF